MNTFTHLLKYNSDPPLLTHKQNTLYKVTSEKQHAYTEDQGNRHYFNNPETLASNSIINCKVDCVNDQHVSRSNKGDKRKEQRLLD